MLSEIAAFLIDLDGVVYQGDRAIPGAADALQWLRRQGLPHHFVTNTSSRPRSALVDKLAGMDIEVAPEDILTPVIAAADWLRAIDAGPVGLFVPEATKEDFSGLELAPPDPSVPVSAVVVGDYGARWSFEELNLAFRWLMQEPRPHFVALGMTRYLQEDDGLRLDTGPFVAALEYAAGAQKRIFGKPDRSFFEAGLRHLGADPAATCMIGDDMLSDIGGAQAAGINGMLVKTGKFRPTDLGHGALPMVILPSLAELPKWWEEHH